MKKTICAILAVLLCGTMFAGCNKKREFEKTIKDLETSTEVTTTVETTEKAKTETTKEETTTEKTTSTEDVTTKPEQETKSLTTSSTFDKSIFIAGYKNLGEGTKIDKADSKTNKLFNEVAKSETLYSYMSKSTSEGESFTELCVNGNDFYIRSDMYGEIKSMYIVDMVLTMYSESTMTAQRATISQEDYNSFVINQYKLIFNIDEFNTFKSYETNINGEKYTYEVDVLSNSYFVYDQSGNLVFSTNVIPNTDQVTIYALTTEVPADIWVQPAGYEITDMDSLQ